MGKTHQPFFQFSLLFILIIASAAVASVQGSRGPIKPHSIYPKREMIGSVAPTCTYNECRGCKYKCRAEQVPVEGNDPIHSAYHYKCVCHR